MVRSAWRLPGYRVEDLIGAGSSGEVWRARVVATGVPVALKRLWLAGRGQREAALTEAALLSALDHPHLMRLHEVRYVGDEAIVLVLDLAAGGSLADLLARRGRLMVGEVVTATAPIGAALAHAHAAGVVHGDVSAANILFTDIGLPLLADLGMARLLGGQGPVGTTPCYADPVVAAGALPVPSSDVFMLAGIALHALTGAPTWSGTAPSEQFEQAADGRQPDFVARLSAAGVPVAVRTVLARALSVDPRERGTATEFALDLRHAAEPVAVELSAGRTRLPPLRPEAFPPAAARAVSPASWPLEPLGSQLPPWSPVVGSDAPDGRSSDVGAAPDGGLGEPVPFVGQQPLTYGVRAPAPFRTANGRHVAPGHRSRPARALVLGVVAACIAVSAGLWVWSPWSSGSPQGLARAAAQPGVTAPSTSTPTSARPPVRPVRPTAAGVGGSVYRAPTRTELGAALAGLDATRASAFAQRRPELLARVYDSPALLARDQALLSAIVPAGCGLLGVRTSFTELAVTAADAGAVTVSVRAAVRPSRLVCGGVLSGRAAGTVATPIQVSLVVRRVGDGSAMRIAGEHTVAGSVRG